MKKDWIVFFGEDWGGLNSTGQYLARKLQADYKILWINSIGLREPDLSVHDIKRIYTKLRNFIFSTKPIVNIGVSNNDESIFPVDLISIPYLRFSIIRKTNRLILSFLLKQKFKQFQISDPMIITACPSTADIVDILKAKKVIYYCADQYQAQPGMNNVLVNELETKLIKASDLVVVTSKSLIDEKKKFAKEIKYLPHGVNYEHLSQAVKQKYDVPEDIKSLKGPLIGYVGSIGNHLNFDFIMYVADKIKDGCVVMIGPCEDDVKNLPRHERIIYLGMKNYSQLPIYLQNFSVCIMPWNSNSERIKFAHPTKLREYLSAGVPVVSLAHTEVEGVSKYIYMSKTKKEFFEKITMVLDSNFDHIEISRSMENEDWSFRSKTLLDYMKVGC